MAVYSVTYDLNQTGQNYEGVIGEIKKSRAYIKYQKSAWLINTLETPDQVVARIEKYLDKNDSLLVIEVKKNYQGWLTDDQWKFIREELFD